MELSWKTGPAAANSVEEAVVQVSELRLRSARDVPSFLFDAWRIRRTVLSEPGALGLSLRASLGQRTFWTLSAWKDEDNISRFMRGPVHRTVMTRYRGRMEGSHFHTWFEADLSQQSPQWSYYLPLFEQKKGQS